MSVYHLANGMPAGCLQGKMMILPLVINRYLWQSPLLFRGFESPKGMAATVWAKGPLARVSNSL